MKKKAFTPIEILITVIIISILATLGFPAYQNAVEASKEKTCSANLEVLQTAVEIYTREHNTVPGSLSELKPEHIEKAFAKVMQGKYAWKKLLAYFIVEGPQWGLAYAQGFGFPHLRCPKNPDTSPTAISYGLNAALANMSSSAYNATSGNIVTVADSNEVLFYYSTCIVPGVNPTDPPPDDSYYLRYLRPHKKNSNVFLKGITKDRSSVRIMERHVEDDKGNHL